VNAIVHRDYVIKGSEIHIDIYDDRLEIVSPGGMADGKRIQDMKIESIASVRRNPVLCDIMHRLKFMERRGSGLKKIVEAYHADVKPEFKSTPQSFIVVLKNLNYSNEENKVQNKVQIKCNDCTLDEQAIIKFISKKPQATQKAIAEVVGKSERTIKTLMIGLQEKRIIERSGSKKTGIWVVR
jgi:predicted HTH transcriptional regulator